MADTACILLVDDDPALLDMAALFIGADYRLIPCTSGEEALTQLRGGLLPDLILLDIDMPQMDGYETLRRLRETDSDTPVIFLTGQSGSESELRGLELGAQDYITKPFVRENLLARIRLRLEAGRQARLLRERALVNESSFEAVCRELSDTERKVARLIAEGYDNREIVQALSYSDGYVRNLTTQIFQKLNVPNRRELRRLLRS